MSNNQWHEDQAIGERALRKPVPQPKAYLVEMVGIDSKSTKKASLPMMAISPRNAVELAIYQVDMGELDSFTVTVTLVKP